MPIVGTRHCPLVSVSWSGLLDWTGAVGVWDSGSRRLTDWLPMMNMSLTSTLHSHTDTVNNWRHQRDALLPANKTSAKRALFEQPDNFVEAAKQAVGDFYPNIRKLLIIGCTLPVCSCQAERSFSFFWRIKTWLRNNMGETRLSALSLMGIHYARTVDIDEVVDEFVRVHPADCLTTAFLTRSAQWRK